MALRDFAAIDAALATIFDNDVAPQINRAVVGLQVLPVVPADGKNITWDVKFGTATPSTAPIADGTDVSAYNSDDKVPATLNYTTYHDAFSISGRALAAAAASGNPAQLGNLFADDMADSIERLASALGTHIYTGTGASNQVLGLVDATAGGLLDSGTYAGVSAVTYTQWKGNVVDAETSNLTHSRIRELLRKIYIASGKKPDLFLCDPIQHEKLAATYGPNRRYIQEVKVRGQQIVLDGGYNVLEFDGIPVIEDIKCPAGYFIAVNSRETRIRQIPPGNAAVTGAMGSVALGGTPETQMGGGKTRLMGHILPLARTGDAHKFGIYIYPQVQVRSRNAGGFIKNLAS